MSKKKNSLKLLQSIKFKILIPVILCTIICITAIISFLLSIAKNQIIDMTKDNILNLAEAYGGLLDLSLSSGNGEDLDTESLERLLKDVSLEGISSSYAYLVNKEGTMLYHPTADKIGSSVENSVVQGLVADIKAGNIPEPDVVAYDFNGTVKFAGFYVCANNSILVITADNDEILAPITSLTYSMLISGALITVLLCLILYFMVDAVAKPIKKLTGIIKDTAEFNFKEEKMHKLLLKRNDETGEMARAVSLMRENLRNIIMEIERVSKSLGTTAADLQGIALHVNEYSSDNSATSEELAASMEETAATTETIDANIGMVNQDIVSIKEYTDNGFSIAKEILDRAEELKATTKSASENTKSIYLTVKEDSDSAIKNAGAIHKINDLTEAIKQIAEQTSLLALNASIEAARAGESGRGFAVVASEIGNLANQSSKTVQEITDIVKMIYDSVNAMSDCLNKTLDFMGNAITKDYDNFLDVSNRYSNDAHVVHTSMQDISVSVETLEKSVSDIMGAITGINVTIAEAASGVTDIANKTSEIVSMSAKTKDMVEDNNTYSDRLKAIVDLFAIS